MGFFHWRKEKFTTGSIIGAMLILLYISRSFHNELSNVLVVSVFSNMNGKHKNDPLSYVIRLNNQKRGWVRPLFRRNTRG